MTYFPILILGQAAKHYLCRHITFRLDDSCASTDQNLSECEPKGHSGGSFFEASGGTPRFPKSL
jgi:hypothetical protein